MLNRVEHTLIALSYKQEKPTYSNQQQSQNKNSFLFQALLTRLKSFHICPKPASPVVRIIQRQNQKQYLHRQTFLIFWLLRKTRSTMPNTGHLVQRKWSCLLKHYTIPNQLLLSYNYKLKLHHYKTRLNNTCNLSNHPYTLRLHQPHHQCNHRVSLRWIRLNSRNQLQSYPNKNHPRAKLSFHPLLQLRNHLLLKRVRNFVNLYKRQVQKT